MYCKHKLKEIDSTYSSSGEKCIFDYHRYKFRKITALKRNIYINPSISISSKYSKPIEDIKKRIKEGKSLLKYQSRMLKSTDYDDGLLMDWGIQHLHLGEITESDGFVERTGDLLFVRFTNNSAYIIDIFNHRQWSTKKMLEIVHKYWSESIEDYKVKGITDISSSPDEESIQQFRKIGLNYIVELSDGSYYMGPGGGITTAKSPMQVTNNVLHLRRLFRNTFDYIAENFKEICEVIKEDSEQEIITVGLRLEDGQLVYTLNELKRGIIL